jgi:hypothetical protein
MSDTDSDTTAESSDYELDDEWEYYGYRVGRPTRSAEVDALDGTHTIEEGTLTAELVHEDDLRITWKEGGWVSHYVSPDGGVGFGIGEGNSGGVAVPYDLVGVINFPEPMTEKEADEWLDDEQLLRFTETTIESDITAADLLEEFDNE